LFCSLGFVFVVVVGVSCVCLLEVVGPRGEGVEVRPGGASVRASEKTSEQGDRVTDRVRFDFDANRYNLHVAEPF
jgi:hypothetical protein